MSSYGRFMSHRISHLSQSATTHSNNHASSNNHISPNDHINSGNHLNHQDADCMDIHHAIDDVKFQSEPSEQITQQAHQPKHNLKSNMSLWTYSLLGLGAILSLMLISSHIANQQMKHNHVIIDITEELTHRLTTLTIDIEQLALLTQANDDLVALIPAVITQVEDNANRIDTLLHHLQSGGQIQNRAGETILIQAVNDVSNNQALANLNLTWQRQQSLLQPLLTGGTNFIHHDDNDTLALANFAYLNHQSMADTLKQLTQERRQQNAYWTSVTKKVFWSGFILLAVYLLWLVVYFTRRIKQSNAKMRQIAHLNDELFATAYDGLFFLDIEGRITERQSPTLTSIIGIDKLSHRRFLSLLERRIPKADHERAKNFINEIYQGLLTNDDIDAKNPLKSVSFIVHTGTDAPSKQSSKQSLKQLSFSFILLNTATQSQPSPLFSTQADEHLLVRVRPANITTSVLTSHPTTLNPTTLKPTTLNKTNHSTSKHINSTDLNQLEPLTQLLTIIDATDATRLLRFMKRMDVRLSMLNQALNDLSDIQANDTHTDDAHTKPTKNLTQDKANNHTLASGHIDFLLRTAHSILIDAKASDLPPYVQHATQIHHCVQMLSTKQNVHSSAKDDALTTALHAIEQLTLLQQTAYQQVYQQRQHLPDDLPANQPVWRPTLTDKLSLTVANDLTADNRATVASLTQFVENEVKTQQKHIHLHCPTWNESGLSNTQRCMIYDISLQLLSNAIHHGIEPATLRIGTGKTAYGQIRIHLTKTKTADGHAHELQCSDDGGGIDFKKLVQDAMTAGLIEQKNAKHLSDEQIIKLLFSQKLYRQSVDNRVVDNNKSGTDTNQGSGMGMQLVKHHVKALNARLFIDSQQAKYSKFRIEFMV